MSEEVPSLEEQLNERHQHEDDHGHQTYNVASKYVLGLLHHEDTHEKGEHVPNHVDEEFKSVDVLHSIVDFVNDISNTILEFDVFSVNQTDFIQLG